MGNSVLVTSSASVESASAVICIERHWDAVTYITVGITALLGMAFALVMPPFQFNDEHGHFARAYQIARGELVGRRNPRLPSAVLSSLRRYPEGLDPEGLERKFIPPTSPADLLTAGRGEVTGSETIGDCKELRYFSWGNLAYQVYWPISYLPASIRNSDCPRVRSVCRGDAVRSAFDERTVLHGRTRGHAFRCSQLSRSNDRDCLDAHDSAPGCSCFGDPATIAFSLVGFALVLRTRERPVSRRYLVTVLVMVPLWVLCKTVSGLSRFCCLSPPVNSRAREGEQFMFSQLHSSQLPR